MSHGRVITSGFSPPWWLRNPHLQTFWPVLFRRQSSLSHRPERLELPDGDFVDLCWTGPDHGPLVIVLHGLQGSIRSPYAVGILRALAARGIRGVLMHFRGCSGQPNRLARGYHSGETGDLRFLLSTLRQREPETPLAAIGYSLGGNVLLKYLGEAGPETPLRAGVAVSVPLVLRTASDRLGAGLSRIYDRYLLRALLAGAKRKAPLLRAAGLDVEAVLGCRSIRAFDEHLTAPLHGFSDASDYYTRCSSRGFLKAIRRPTLILHASDDPFMRPEVVPDASELAASVTLELSSGGGHVGFVSGFGRYWLEERIPEFVSSVLLPS
ncbi:MAG: hydrolase [Myxococcota bacterium]|nr:hydrolase [Myxococcota bacterium]